MKSVIDGALQYNIDKEILLKAYSVMFTAQSMSALFDENKTICSRYVHSTSRGHEAIQVATGLQLQPYDFASVYYRDDSILLALGISPYEMMLQLMAKAEDPFSGGRTYYCHPSLRRKGFPTIPHQSSATGMQAIPATGMAHAIQYRENQNLADDKNKPIVICSLGDGSVTEGEVSEAFQMAVLKKLPIIYLVQDNNWGISATSEEMRAMDSYEFAAGFKGMKRMQVNGSNFMKSYLTLAEAIHFARTERSPVLVHAKCPLLGHHTSGVRKEWYRGKKDLHIHEEYDPIPFCRQYLVSLGEPEENLANIEKNAKDEVFAAFQKALEAPEPNMETLMDHEFAPTPILEEKGIRSPKAGEKVTMVDAALHAVDEILQKHPEALFYGQDVGSHLGGVFREAANLAKKWGDGRVFNTPIQEAYIVGSTVGMSAVGCKPIVEIQFADYVWPGINQLVEELSKSCYLSNGQFPVQSLIRIPIGPYGGGGPYHSGSIESTLLNIKGIKVVYPSNAADMKGLLKASFYDPNPVVLLEHKGLYWSKLPGTEDAKRIMPDKEYIIPLGKAAIALKADEAKVFEGQTVLIISYGMGIYWAKEAAKALSGIVEILDLRTLYPLDWEAVVRGVKKHNKVLVLTEEPLENSFAESLAGRISMECFQFLDAPVMILGSENLPAVPLNINLEKAMLPNSGKVKEMLLRLIEY
ncbi:MAG: thiamine pyrophosphate-dependent enzyme [Bacteroidota bacterium]|nr:thiamine pyrophosphate-dependent enzyme [Bacteroidota bacterium]